MSDDKTATEEADGPPIVQATAGAFAEMLSGPAYFANKIYASNLPLGMRITFLETAEGDIERYRTAVFLTWPDVLALKELLMQQLSHIQMRVEEGEPEQPAGNAAG